MDLALKDRRVVITGASSGIGRAAAFLLASEGAKIVLGARDEERLAATVKAVKEISPHVVHMSGDLRESECVDSLIGLGVREFGGVDGLVCSVGSTPLGRFTHIDDAAWAEAFNGKFLSTVRAVRAAIPVLKRSHFGRVVIIAGNSAHFPAPDTVTSATMNAGLGALAFALARDYASDGVGFVCIDPGPTRTARFEQLANALAESEGLTREQVEVRICNGLPTGRICEPREVADVVAMCLSPRATQLTGTRITIDGAATWK